MLQNRHFGIKVKRANGKLECDADAYSQNITFKNYTKYLMQKCSKRDILQALL